MGWNQPYALFSICEVLIYLFPMKKTEISRKNSQFKKEKR